MSTRHWRLNDQQFNGPLGSFLRIGEHLHFRPTGDEKQFRQLEVKGTPHYHGSGQILFDFRDATTEVTGTLGFTENVCAVYINGETTAYQPAQPSPQVPAIVFKAAGYEDLLYISRSVYDPPHVLRHAWWVAQATTHNGRLVDMGDLTDQSTWNQSFLTFHVEKSGGRFHIWPRNVLDTGKWTDDTDLYRVHDLSGFDIKHAPDGTLAYFARKG